MDFYIFGNILDLGIVVHKEAGFFTGDGYAVLDIAQEEGGGIGLPLLTP